MDRLSQFNDLRPALFSLAYRILGQRADAEDVLQEAFLRWQNATANDIQSPKPYLMKVVGRLSLDALKVAHRRREQYVGPWLPEPLVDHPAPHTIELAESLSIAFLHILEKLSPAERVAFLLHEVFDSSYPEVAESLETSEANCRQLVARARKHLHDSRSRYRVDPDRHEAILRSFLTSCSTGDAASLTSMLREDVILYSDGGGRTRAALNPIYGADRVVRFLLGIAKKAPEDATLAHITNVNGEPGLILQKGLTTVAIVTIDLDEDGTIRGLFWVVNPDKLPPLPVR